MAEPSTGAVFTMSLASILAAQPFGISIQAIAIGTGFSLVGVVGRAAFELQKASEGAGGMSPAKVLGWVGAGFIGAPFVTILYLVILNLAKIQSDGIAIVGLLFFGYSGPRMVTWLLNLVVGQLNKRLGMNIPALGQAAPPGGGQP